MAKRKPIVLVDNEHTPLPAGDELDGVDTSIVLSPDAGNLLQDDPQGLLAKLSVDQTLKGVGTNANQLGVKIDPAAGQLISTSINGVRVSLRTSNPSSGPTVALSGAGTPTSPLTAAAVIATKAGNALTVVNAPAAEQGLFVQKLVAGSGIAIDGTNNDTVRVRINGGSPAANTRRLIYIDSIQTLEGTLTLGDGLGWTAPGATTAKVLISPEEGNLLSLTPGGYLRALLPSSSGVTADGTSITGDGTTDTPLTVRRQTGANNMLVTSATGLVVDAKQDIIPKFEARTNNIDLAGAEIVQSPSGMGFRMLFQVTVANPTGKAAVGGVGVYSVTEIIPNFYFCQGGGASRKAVSHSVHHRIASTTATTITYDVVMLSDADTSLGIDLYDIFSDVQVGGSGQPPLTVVVKVIGGFTPTQLGM